MHKLHKESCNFVHLKCFSFYDQIFYYKYYLLSNMYTYKYCTIKYCNNYTFVIVRFYCNIKCAS